MARAAMEKSMVNSANILESGEITDDLVEAVNLASTGVLYGMYILDSNPILDEVEKLMMKPLNICPRTGKKQGVKEEDELVVTYFNTLRKYQSIIDFPVPSNETSCSSRQRCPDCDSASIHTDDEEIICSNCCAVIGEVDVFTSFTDSERLHVAPRHTADRSKTVEEAIRKFQGLGDCKVPDKLIEGIKSQIVSMKIAINDVTPRIVRDILKTVKGLNGNKYYDQMVYIWHKITKKRRPNISSIERFIIEDIAEMERVHHTLTICEKQNRTSFPNMSYVFRRVIERHGFYFSDGFFPSIKSSETQSYLQTICDTIFHRLGWPIVTNSRSGDRQLSVRMRTFK